MLDNFPDDDSSDEFTSSKIAREGSSTISKAPAPIFKVCPDCYCTYTYVHK